MVFHLLPLSRRLRPAATLFEQGLRNALSILLSFAPATFAADAWPTYMFDNGRGGMSPAPLATPLQALWTYQAPAAPKPAWPPPQEDWTELPKTAFDRALFTIAAEGQVFFGSSVDNCVHALDAASGKERWTFFTGGPVRLAPAYAKGRIYAGSDDGRIYCLDARDGRAIWVFDGGAIAMPVLGSGRVISMSPARAGVLVEGDTVYTSIGIFPMYGASLYAVNADTGKQVWQFPRPADRKATGAIRGGFSPQGYLLKSGANLVVPCGRTIPAVFTAATGELLGGIVGRKGARAPKNALPKSDAGGTYGTVAGNILYLGTQGTLLGYNVAEGTPAGNLPTTHQVLVGSNFLFTLHGTSKPLYGRIKPEKTAVQCLRRQGAGAGKKAPAQWEYARPGLVSIIGAGSTIVAGGSNEVVVLDAATGRELWKAPVKGNAFGLAAAEGRLLVSTDRGAIYGFGKGGASAGAAPASRALSGAPQPARAAAAIREIDAAQGYVVVLGPGAVDLAIDMARKSALSIYAFEAGPEAVDAARRRVAAAGLYGWRVTVDALSSGIIPFPDYAANGVIAIAGANGAPIVSASELLRVLKPCGGVLLAGAWNSTAGRALPESLSAEWAQEGRFAEAARLDPAAAPWQKFVRGALPGSAWWTHQFADPGNTGASADERVKGRLDVTWYGEPGADKFSDRHMRSSAPMMVDGRIVTQGFLYKQKKDILFSFDAYNGAMYWERELPAARRLNFPGPSGNMAITSADIFIAAGPECHRLDLKTGVTRTVYKAPKRPSGQAGDWSYVAVSDNVLVGGVSRPAAKPMPPSWTISNFSEVLFAIDLSTGKQLWTHSAPEIRDTTIACGGGRVYVLENRKAGAGESQEIEDEPQLGDATAVSNGEKPPADTAGKSKVAEDKPPLVRTLVALDMATGKTVWERQVDLKDCGTWNGGAFGTISMLCKEPYLAFGGAHTPYGRAPADAPNRRVLVVSTKDGETVWSKAVGNRSRPIIVGDLLIAEPLIYRLATGERATATNPKTGKTVEIPGISRNGGCGSLSASACMAFFRAGSTGWRDIASGGGGGGGFVGLRPGCFINIIPAGGTAVEIEASSGCACYYALQCTMAFAPRERTPLVDAPSSAAH